VAKHEDFESTTQILARRAPGLAWLPAAFRNHLTPTAVWSAIGALAIAIGYVINAQHELHTARNDIAALQKQTEILTDIKSHLAVMDNKLDTIALEVDRQRQWRERIESVAETPPHSRNKK
jgi:hypothetical protein